MGVPQFTPGPWIRSNREAIARGFHRYIASNKRSNRSDIARVMSLYSDKDAIEAEANANLIAAAPELYEALTRCHALFIGDDTETPIAQMVDAALAKARGEVA